MDSIGHGIECLYNEIENYFFYIMNVYYDNAKVCRVLDIYLIITYQQK